MDANIIVQLVGSLGFPIVASGALFWYIVKQQDKITEAINNNTQALMKLMEKVDNAHDDN